MTLEGELDIVGQEVKMSKGEFTWNIAGSYSSLTGGDLEKALAQKQALENSDWTRRGV